MFNTSLDDGDDIQGFVQCVSVVPQHFPVTGIQVHSKTIVGKLQGDDQKGLEVHLQANGLTPIAWGILKRKLQDVAKVTQLLDQVR